MAKQSVEEIKRLSDGLRGQIEATLQADASHFEEAEYQLLKFHGTYQQDDRDIRTERRKQKLDKLWSFMVRSKMPGGRLTADQYLAHDRLAEDIGNKDMRLTTRQGIQLHGILMGGLKEVIATIKNCGLTTLGACGDVVRNTMGPAAPIDDVAHRDAQLLTEELTEMFLPHTTSYADLWLNGEKLDLNGSSNGNDEGQPDHEPIYGKTYLPRKFKIGIGIPPRNDADIFSQDIGLVPHLAEDGDSVAGYSIFVGGGFGMTHGMVKTRPVLAKPLGYASRETVIEVCTAVVGVQREYGNRSDRKLSRLKYLVENSGIKWFRNAVETRLGRKLDDVREVRFETVADSLGWHEQGNGKLYRGVHVAQGRIEDNDSVRYRSAFRDIAQKYGVPMIVTGNTNLIIADIDPGQKQAIETELQAHGIPNEEAFTDLRKVAHACVALPTCGLSLSESERVFGTVLNQIDEILFGLGLEHEPLLVRMTGCPNGCARPYNSDIAFVGRGPAKYAMYVGGSSRGDRLAGLYKKVVMFDDIADEVRPLLEDFSENREAGESFTDYWGRTQPQGQAPDPEQFHVELAERAKTLSGGCI